MRPRCRANIPRRACSSGWDRTRIWSPIRYRGAKQINVVAIVPGTWNRPGWSAQGDANEIKSAFASQRWPATARMLVGAVDEWRRWALFTLPDLGEWSSGAVALLGDAAHAMLPFAAQGAGMAIEDAAVLAGCLSQSTGDNIAGYPGSPEALRPAAARPRAAGAARRPATGPHLSSHRAAGAGARSRHQGDGPPAHAGAAGLDLRLAGVRRLAGIPGRWWPRRP